MDGGRNSGPGPEGAPRTGEGEQEVLADPEDQADAEGRRCHEPFGS